MKLALGTVQFGLDYGVTGNPRIPINETHEILSLAMSAGVDILDTAPSYGDSEKIIGQWLNDEPGSFRVITKVPRLNKTQVPVDTIQKTFQDSLEQLGVDSVYALLLHNVSDLMGAYGKQVFTAMQNIQSKGLAERIGISVYSPEEIDFVISQYPIQIVQAPFNVIDQRLLQDGILRRLKEADIEIHVRSVFLQGLLLLTEEKIPSYFSPWSGLLKQYRTWCSDTGGSLVAACLQFVYEQAMIDKIIVGVDSISHFRELLDVTQSATTLPDATHLACVDKGLINPTCWPQ